MLIKNGGGWILNKINLSFLLALKNGELKFTNIDIIESFPII